MSKPNPSNEVYAAEINLWWMRRPVWQRREILRECGANEKAQRKHAGWSSPQSLPDALHRKVYFLLWDMLGIGKSL